MVCISLFVLLNMFIIFFKGCFPVRPKLHDSNTYALINGFMKIVQFQINAKHKIIIVYFVCDSLMSTV